MTKRLLLSACLALAMLFSTGCLFTRKSAKPKEDPGLARETEQEFRQRWVEKRVSELVAAGTAAPAARTQAEAEFREKYEFTSAAQK
jgi:1,2-phenylacetyl-CoA epoxidase catalytic subunit